MADGPTNPLTEFNPPKPPPFKRLIIDMDRDGNVQITGPVQEQVLCYGMLKMAELAIQKFHAKEQSLIQPAEFLLPRT